MAGSTELEFRDNVRENYSDVYTPGVMDALAALAPMNRDVAEVMKARLECRRRRACNRERISFLDPDSRIARTTLTVKDARAGQFDGSPIPADLARQWIQGTGPGAKPRTEVK